MYARLVQGALVVVLVAGACTTMPSRPPTATSMATAALPTSTPAASMPVAISASATIQTIRSPLAPRIAATGVWTGSEVILWGGWQWEGDGVSGPLGDGAAYDPAVDDWRALPDAPIDARAQHLAVWTGREMLVWGGFTKDRTAPSAGAAYDPSAGQWRTLAPSPVKWAEEGTASVWADGEWVIAIARDRTNDIEVVAYDPNVDRWRNLPGLAGPLSDENQLVWTGSELLLVNVAGGLFRLDPEKQTWISSVTPPVWGPVVWTGDRLLGVAGNDPSWLVEWDPATDVWSDLPMPAPLREAELVWTGDRAIFANSGLAFDPSTPQWWKLNPAAAFHRSESVILWAGDRVVMLGGWPGGPSGPIPFGEAYVPAW